tara:strand:+ start:103 stop:591 length:489 start_codon:yes stop_codon:yes gene_type:complete
MGSNGASSGGNGGNNRSRFREQPKPKANPIVEFVKGGGITGMVVRGVSDAIKRGNKKSKQNLMDYEGQAAGVTPMRGLNNFTSDRDGGNVNTQFNVASTSPTTAEISQSSAIDASSLAAIDTTLADKRKVKKKGRSSTILTSSKGIKPDETLTLGKRSLLGS